MRKTIVLGLNAVWQKIFDLPKVELGEVLRASHLQTYASGKGANVAIALDRLGHPCHLIQCCGGANGALANRDLKRFTFLKHNIEISNETRCCTTLRENSGRTTELIEPSPSLSQEEWEEVVSTIMQCIALDAQHGNDILISGTLPSGPDQIFFENLGQRDSHTHLWVDSVEPRYLGLSPEVLKINHFEACSLAQCSSLERAGERLVEQFGLKNLVITQQQQPGWAFCEGEMIRFSVPPAQPCRNTIGAGDSFFAGLLHARQMGQAWDSALNFASSFASLRCQFDRIEEIPLTWSST